MSYYSIGPQAYRPVPPGTPGWSDAPVPGWGVNPLLAGPPRVGVGSSGSSTEKSHLTRNLLLLGGGLVLAVALTPVIDRYLLDPILGR